MKYCRKCLLPDTKPDLTFDETGLCSACSAYDARPTIDWESREKELIAILDKYKGTHYDCIVPVSGGKDSTYQVIKILELGYKPLCVTATTCDLSDLGRRNIENIKRLGVDSDHKNLWNIRGFKKFIKPLKIIKVFLPFPWILAFAQK